MHRTIFMFATALTSLGLITGCASSSGHNHHHHGTATIHSSQPTIGEIPQTGPTYGQAEGAVDSGQTW